MERNYTIDRARLITQLIRFQAFVQHMDGNQNYISFRDSAGFLGCEEDYKSGIAEKAREELKYDNWKEEMIGTGAIADCVKKAMSKAENLVFKNQQVDFKNRLDPNHPKYRKEAEQVLYNIYRNQQYDESKAFEDAIEIFGAKYDTIAFLFFIKNDNRFLPISTGHFDKGFDILGIDYKTSKRCSWENYQGYLSIISEIREMMENVLAIRETLRLIDAHSFVWIIQQERFIDWIPDKETSIQIENDIEAYIQNTVTGSGKRRSRTTNAFVRSAEVVKETRRRAKGICQLCDQQAPFLDKKGEPYLEVHHVKWLSRSGEDSTDNTVALCPNCHARMHVLDDTDDVEKLKRMINDM